MIAYDEIEQFAYETTLTWSDKIGGLSEEQFASLKEEIIDTLYNYSEPS